MIFHVFSRGVCLLSLIVLASCAASSGSSGVANPRNPPPNSSPTFQAGYEDGCRNGYHDIGHTGYDGNENARYDSARYVADGEYRAGRDLGYKTCRDDDLRTPYRGGGY